MKPGPTAISSGLFGQMMRLSGNRPFARSERLEHCKEAEYIGPVAPGVSLTQFTVQFASLLV